jgi:hypothetical protein
MVSRKKAKGQARKAAKAEKKKEEAAETAKAEERASSLDEQMRWLQIEDLLFLTAEKMTPEA